jgi:integrase
MFLDYLGNRQDAEAKQEQSFKQGADTPVITNEVGGWYDPCNFSRWWYWLTDRYGFPGLRFHDLRHTQATLLISQGVDIKTVQNRLGHTLASTTLDLYAGVIPGNDRQAASIMGALLSDAGGLDSKVVNL